MKSYIAFLLIFFVLTGCSQKKSDSNPLSQQSIVTQGSGTFGSVAFGENKVQSFTFKNDSQEVLSLAPSISNASFSLAFVLGCDNLEPGKSCLVKVMFSALNKEAGNYSADLSVGQTLINLTASIDSVPETSYQVFLDNALISESMDLGTLTGNHLKLMSFKIKNNSPKTGNLSSLTFSNPRFNIVGNTCSNRILKPSQVCVAKVYVRGDNTNSILSTNLSFDNKTSALSYQQEEQILNAQMMSLNSSITLGDFYEEGDYKIQVITVQNQGEGVGSIENVSLPAGYSLGSNNCVNVKPGNKCLIRLVYESKDQNKGQYTDTISVGDDEVDLVSNQVSEPNSLSSITIQANDDLMINQCHSITISLKDTENLDFVSSQVQEIVSSHTLYSDTSCTQTSLSLAPFESSKVFYIKQNDPQVINLSISKNTVNSTKSINFYAPLSVQATAPVIITTQSITLLPQGGKAPYSYQIVSGVGQLIDNVFSSQVNGNAQIKITDILNQEVFVSVQIVYPLQASISTFEKIVGQTQLISGLEGLSPYTYEKVSGVGSIDFNSGLYSSGASEGTVQLKIKDSLNQEVLVSGQVYSVLTVQSPSVSITTANNSSIVPQGGKVPYSYLHLSGVGQVTPSGVFSSNVAGNGQVKVVDALNQEAIVNFTVSSNLTVTAGTCSFEVPEQVDCQVSATGGVGTLTYSVDVGVINSANGSFYGVCSGLNQSSQTSVVTVSDSYGNQSSVNLNYPCVFLSCNQIKTEVPAVISGQFWIDTDSDRSGDAPVKVFCDHEQEKGGWNLVAKYGNTSNNLRHWFVTSYSTLSLDDTFPNSMQIAPYANKLVRRAEEIKVNFLGAKINYYTINQLTADKLNLWNNTPVNIQIGSIGVRPTGFSTSPYNPGQPVRSHFGSYGGTTGSGFTSGLSSNQTLDTVSNCTTYCAYRLPGIGTTPGSAWDVQSSPLHAYVKEPYYKLPRTCLDAKNKGTLNTVGTTATGYYLIDPDGANMGNDPFEAYCDMTTDGGGWTLISYAGTISSNKINLVGSNHYPLFNTYGSYQKNALTSKASFSRVDLIKPVATATSRFLARRTSNYNKQISWKLANPAWYGGTVVTPSTIGFTDGTIVDLRTTITGEAGWVNKANAFLTRGSSGSSSYPGISWNTPTYENSDNYGSYSSSLNRRSILYWESGDSPSYPGQWFHAQPLSLAPSTGANNSVQDIEFYFRE